MGDIEDSPSSVAHFKSARGNREIENKFYEAAFRRLRVIAAALLRKERSGHALQPTALISEFVPETAPRPHAHLRRGALLPHRRGSNAAVWGATPKC
jgi:ECF sigma factor